VTALARIAGVNIPTNKRVLIGLQYIHGIGSSKAREIVTKVGIPDERRVSQLTDQEVLQIREVIDRDYLVEGDLRRETAMNICRRIYRHFVYHNITGDIDTTIVSDLADTFTSSGFKIQPVLEELFQSQHFYDAAAGVAIDVDRRSLASARRTLAKFPNATVHPLYDGVIDTLGSVGATFG